MSQSNNSSSDSPSRISFGNGAGFGASFVCEVVGHINSRGFWFGDDPLSFSFPLLLLQLSLISIFTRSIYILLKPFGQPSIVSQILGGVVLGPSVLGHNSNFAEKVFPTKGRTILETLSIFGFMLFLFLIGVKTDPSIIFRSGKRVYAIGAVAFCIPYALAAFARLVLCHLLSLSQSTCKVLQLVVKLQSLTAFPVIATFLAELRILNSEIGRLASSSSMICDLCFWFTMSMSYAADIAIAKSLKTSMGSFLSAILLLSLIVFGIRPAALWAIRRTPEGKPVKEIYTFIALVALMGCVFIGEVIGIDALISSFLVGLVIPDGPPLGAALVERLDCFVSVLLTPIFFTLCGLKTNVFTIQKWKTVGAIQLVFLVGFFGKLIGTMLPPLFCRIPFRDALSLGLIMNSRGIVELILINDWRTANVLNDEGFAIMIISVVVVTGVISPLVKTLYDPSRRFLAYRRRTIQHHRRNQELRILACIHSQDNVQTLMTLLNASNATKEEPIGLFVLHLIKLTGRASSLLTAYRPRDKPSPCPTQSERIFNAFNRFGQESCGHVTVHCYKGISPRATMHNDVCSLALEHRISLIIVPFHRECINGKMIDFHVYRHLNRNVLDKAPCSVGILLDRGNPRKSPFLHSETSAYRVALLFFGGADDREALAYAGRMSKNPCVLVTLLHFKISIPVTEGTARSKMLDCEILDEFRFNAQWNERASYIEEVVIDSKDVLASIGAMDNAYDLVMVGKRHGDSKLMSELERWNHDKELGPVGEIVAARDCKLGASILVVQQQTRVWGMRDPEENITERYINIIQNQELPHTQ
ncbi:cation/H(+) antiporter 15 [Ricinus communis]|uniref:cation/H(+) antiporter 15 n=1 Tax=Ricinus communis TaxID=3988 RepID=UPI0007726C26|nr:cation/H(+) antiporter 15 [Ricinus communis]|eukprot:XP_015575244.1 cation/H(+) antiporter 15 [Ricinus communis]